MGNLTVTGELSLYIPGCRYNVYVKCYHESHKKNDDYDRVYVMLANTRGNCDFVE